MKKILFILLCSVMLFASCSSCHKKKDNVSTELNVENIVSADKEYMLSNYGEYTWFETCIVLQDFLDEECDGTISGISNVFQVIKEKDKGYDTQVVLVVHAADTMSVDIKHGFWVEDNPLNNDSIISFKEAFDKLMAVNLPKPHSQQVVLRKEVGPVKCNPQYIFGNKKSQIYVDAVTGEVSDKNPAFPEGAK